MKKFADLFEKLDTTTSTNAKVAAMAAYFREAEAADAAWAVYFLTGRRLKRLIGPRKLAAWAAAETGLPDWLVEECYSTVGDLAETVSLLVEGRAQPEGDRPLHRWVSALQALRDEEEDEQAQRITGWWRAVDTPERFLLNKLLTGALRVGVSERLVVRALARAGEADEPTVAHRLMGSWQPSAEAFRRLLQPGGEGEETDGARANPAQPYPFYLASPLEEKKPEELGAVEDWLIEWKWDGIRAQLLRRAGETHLWSRGDELVTERYPEVVQAAQALPPGTVLDGELLAWKEEAVLPFGQMQRRIGRKSVGKKLLAEVPVAFMAYDALEWDGTDRREEPLRVRRAKLRDLVGAAGSTTLRLSPEVEATSWAGAARLRETARARGTEGLMLKALGGAYRAGRPRGEWWKWKVDPFTVDCVLVYAQAGHGRRANLYTDYTLAVWEGGELVPVARAYSGLTDAEIAEMDRWIRRHTTERFGPVRAVEPVQVFEIAFEGLRPSTRHKAGLALRFPRIHRWRNDKRPEEADRLESLRAFL